MTDNTQQAQHEAVKPEYDYQYQVDQQVSINAFLDVAIDGENVRFQVTNRYGASPEKIAKTVRAGIEAYRLLRQEFPRELAQPAPQPPAPGEPTYHDVDDSGNDKPKVQKFMVDKLTVNMIDGQYYYKVMGGNFTKWGIPVWPETLQAVGLPTNTAEMPSINGWTAEFIEFMKDGQKRRKVTRLLQP